MSLDWHKASWRFNTRCLNANFTLGQVPCLPSSELPNHAISCNWWFSKNILVPGLGTWYSSQNNVFNSISSTQMLLASTKYIFFKPLQPYFIPLSTLSDGLKLHLMLIYARRKICVVGFRYRKSKLKWPFPYEALKVDTHDSILPVSLQN